MKDIGLRSTWSAAGLRLAALLVVTLLVGLAVDLVFPLLTGVLAGCLAWYGWNLYQLDLWLRRHRRIEPPEGWGLWSSIYDALHRRQRESRARRRRLAGILKEFRDATNAVPDAVVVLDDTDHILWSNPGASELLGLRKRQDAGRPITNLLRNPEVTAWLRQSRDDPDGLIINSPVGEARKLRLRIFPYGEGQSLLLARDITEIQRIEVMRKDFVANVSHELRTPLTVISGYLETMAHAADPEWTPVARKIENQSARMKSIVEDLLTLSRLDSTSALEDDEPVAVEPLIKGLTSEAEILSEGRHRIVSVIEPRLDLRGDARDLRSAFGNLVSNAVRYTPEGGTIKLVWQRNGENAEFSVQDDGPGIAPQHLPRLTERFYRVSSDRSRASGGTGLGLAIVKHILALHEAELEVRSEPGTGSEFICRFPPERLSRPLSQAS